jgi:hypothetical protein
MIVIKQGELETSDHSNLTQYQRQVQLEVGGKVTGLTEPCKVSMPATFSLS